jgi:hypothetical protein
MNASHKIHPYMSSPSSMGVYTSAIILLHNNEAQNTEAYG